MAPIKRFGGGVASPALPLDRSTLYHQNGLLDSGLRICGVAPSIPLVDSIIVRICGRETRAKAVLHARRQKALGLIIYSLGKGGKRSWAAAKVKEVRERIRAGCCPAHGWPIRGEVVRIIVGRADSTCATQGISPGTEGVLDKVENAAEVVGVFLLLVRTIRQPCRAACSGNVAS